MKGLSDRFPFHEGHFEGRKISKTIFIIDSRWESNSYLHVLANLKIETNKLILTGVMTKSFLSET